jgi:hypothetical protein
MSEGMAFLCFCVELPTCNVTALCKLQLMEVPSHTDRTTSVQTLKTHSTHQSVNNILCCLIVCFVLSRLIESDIPFCYQFCSFNVMNSLQWIYAALRARTL